MYSLQSFSLVVVIIGLSGPTAWAQFTSRTSAASAADHSAIGQEHQRPARPGGATSAAAEKRTLQILLREGTSLGPLRGRFVVRGQRWSFQVDTQAMPGGADKSQWVSQGLAREIRPEQGTLLGRHGDVSAAREDAANINAAISAKAMAGDTPPIFDSMLVVENLMLDRIVRAIEEDPQDDFWMITARVTEFQDENRLIVLTANRAPNLTP